jgi:hypothetical protein
MSFRIVKAQCASLLVLLALSACGEPSAPSTTPPPAEPPPIMKLKTPASDIAGRWGMFCFEDPVGIQVSEVAGNLTGVGCASGTPPFSELDPFYCGDVEGMVQANQASFDFHFDRYRYLADTTVSADGQRMTGRFYGAAGLLPYPTAWLHVPDGQIRLTLRDWNDPPEEMGSYDLRLSNADPGATEYVPNKVYSLVYRDNGNLEGDLGCFCDSEVTRPSADGPIQVGPVPPTDPALPVSMSIEVSEQRLTQFSVVTGSGHSYTFSAVPTPIPPPSP